MKKVTTQNLVDFIFAQPRDRKVKMEEASSHDPCGCLMVQYGKEELKIKESFTCGLDNWTTTHGSSEFQMDYDTIGSFGLNLGEEYTYGEVQDIFTQNGFMKTKTDAERKAEVKPISELKAEGYRVDVHHLRYAKGGSRRSVPVPARNFLDTDSIKPKGGKTVVCLECSDGKIVLGESFCCDTDLYNKSEGVWRATERALEKLK